MNPGVPSETDHQIETTTHRSRWGRFFEGMGSAWNGFQFLLQRPALWRYAVLPILFNMLITALVVVTFVGAGVMLFSHVHPWLTEGRAGAAWWLWLALEAVLGMLFVLIAGALAVLVWKLLSGVLCGYFYGVLAEKVELALGADPDDLTAIPFHYEMVDTLLNLAALILVNTGLLFLNIVPVVGGVAALLLGAWSNTFILGLDQFSFPLALRQVRRIDQFRFARRHQGHTLGLGAVVFVFQFVPVIGAVFLTSAVAGAVLLHRKLENS